MQAQEETEPAWGTKQSSYHNTGRARSVWIAEAEYCYDPNYLDKLQEKTQQHRLLQDLLMDEGFKFTCLSTVLGNSGAIHTTTESSLLQLGISRTAAQNLVLKLSDHEHGIFTS